MFMSSLHFHGLDNPQIYSPHCINFLKKLADDWFRCGGHLNAAKLIKEGKLNMKRNKFGEIIPFSIV